MAAATSCSQIAASYSGSSSDDSEGYPSTFCPVVYSEGPFYEFYGDMPEEDRDEDILYEALRDELQEVDDDLDDVEHFDFGSHDYFAFVREYNRVAPQCGWSQEARNRKKQLFAKFGVSNDQTLTIKWNDVLDQDSPAVAAAHDSLDRHCNSGGSSHCSAVDAIIDPLEDEALYEEVEAEAKDDFAIALERLEKSTEEFRQVLRKYGTVTNFSLAHRCGRRYMRAHQPVPRQPVNWMPAFLHPVRARAIRSSGIMHTLLRRLSLFNVTPDFALLNTEFVDSIARRCCSAIMASQLHAQFEQHIEHRIAAGSQ